MDSLLEIEKLKLKEGYDKCLYFENPVPFSEAFKDEDFDLVQLHSIVQIDAENYPDEILGFCGQFIWKNNNLESADGDNYNKDCMVFGFEKFTYDNDKKGLDILVGNDW